MRQRNESAVAASCSRPPAFCAFDDRVSANRSQEPVLEEQNFARSQPHKQQVTKHKALVVLLWKLRVLAYTKVGRQSVQKIYHVFHKRKLHRTECAHGLGTRSPGGADDRPEAKRTILSDTTRCVRRSNESPGLVLIRVQCSPL